MAKVKKKTKGKQQETSFFKKMRKLVLRLALFLFLILSALISYYLFSPLNIDGEKMLQIKSGDGLIVASSRLEKGGYISNPKLFQTFMKLTFSANSIKVGNYKITSEDNILTLRKKIITGQSEQKYLTIAEGLTLKQIKAILDKKVLNNEMTGSFPDDLTEGDLHPNTYAYSHGQSVESFVSKMKQTHDKILSDLWENRAKSLPFKNKEEAVILASLVERETMIDAEKPIVASVFINRLNKGMKLQCDATVVYYFSKKTGNMNGSRLLIKHLQQDNPYNTYTRYGLPMGPIANVGKKALEAVLNPADTDYLYFVADGKGGHLFAKTLKEHQQNHNKWREIRKTYDLNEIRNN